MDFDARNHKEHCSDWAVITKKAQIFDYKFHPESVTAELPN